MMVMTFKYWHLIEVFSGRSFFKMNDAGKAMSRSNNQIKSTQVKTHDHKKS